MRRALCAGLAWRGGVRSSASSSSSAVWGVLSTDLAHATFGGLALGLLLGATVDRAMWVALPFTVAIALGIQYVRRRTTLGGDVATGVFFAVSFAAGILFLGLRSARSAPVNVEGLLFGSLLARLSGVARGHRRDAALGDRGARLDRPAARLRDLRPGARRALRACRWPPSSTLLMALTALVVVVRCSAVGRRAGVGLRRHPGRHRERFSAGRSGRSRSWRWA